MYRSIFIFFHLVSLVFLGLGWTLDMLFIKIDLDSHFLIDLHYNLFNEKRSVIGTLQTLWEGGHYWPFILIFVFGILVPILKSGLIFYLLLAAKPIRNGLNWLTAISKWAMADVFAISILVAFLGAGSMKNTSAVLEAGFYYFSAYVLLSAVIVFLLEKWLKNQAGTNS